MRATGDLFRWGVTCLLIAPVLFIAAWVLGGAIGFAWAALALVLLGAVLNGAAVVRGVRRIGSGSLMADLDGYDPAASAPSVAPRQRIIVPPELEPPTDPGIRRRVGLGATAALFGLIAFGAWTLAVEHPLVIGQDLTLDEVYGYWGSGSTVFFSVVLGVWVLLSAGAASLVGFLAVIPRADLDVIVTPRRMLALAAIVGSAIVVASVFPDFTMGISLPDAMPFGGVGMRGVGGASFSLVGVALSITAILLTVPPWKRRNAGPSRRT